MLHARTTSVPRPAGLHARRPSPMIVLNACWHHGIDHANWAWAISSAQMGFAVLNACWHHGIDHVDIPAVAIGAVSDWHSAQRLLASRNRSPVVSAGRQNLTGGASAQRLLASRNRSRVLAPIRCTAPNPACAQRLLASRNRSPQACNRSRRIYRLTMCSTPAGITESITPHRLTGWSKSNLPGVISSICLVGCRTSR